MIEIKKYYYGDIPGGEIPAGNAIAESEKKTGLYGKFLYAANKASTINMPAVFTLQMPAWQ